VDVLSIQGSPRTWGNTGILLKRILFVLQAESYEIIDTVYPSKQVILECSGCYACQELHDQPGCSLQDDMQTIYEKMLSANLILIATPVICWEMRPQFKAFFGRLRAMFKFGMNPHRSLFEGKRFALVVTSSGSPEGAAEVTEKCYRPFIELARARDCGAFVESWLDPPVMTKDDWRVLSRADAFAENLCRSFAIA